MSFRPSVPCLGVEGARNAAGFTLLPPPAAEFGTQRGWPDTRSGRANALPAGPPNRSIALNGKPLRATITVFRDQSRVTRDRRPDLVAAGTSYATAPEK